MSSAGGRTVGQTVVISGASGLVGTELTGLLKQSGHTVRPMTRKSGTPDAVVWDPSQGILGPSSLENVDTIVHLAGENIAGSRWTKEIKQRIRDSRVEGTRHLVRSLSQLERRPKTLICASATGFYGDRGEELLTENSVAGTGYLAEVCSSWEREAMAATDLGMRVACLRIGVVLSPKGGALAKMLLPFKMCVGGTIGSGRQYWSWIGLHDLVRAIQFCVENDSIHGPVNAVSPNPVTNAEFTKAVAGVLHRPAVFPLPAAIAKIVLGEMAEELLLASVRVVPDKLMQNGFDFQQADLSDCLRYELS